MVECSRCGTAAQPGDVTCRTCGAPLPASPLAGPNGHAPADPWPVAAPAAPPVAWPLPAPTTPHVLRPLAPAQAAPAGVPSTGGATPPARPPYTYPPPYGYPPAAYPPAAYPQQYGYQGYAPYYYPNYGYPYTYPYPPRPRPAKGERYRAVLGWVVTIGAALLLLGGLALLGLLLLDTAIGARFSLASVAGTVGLIVAAVLGGGGGLYLGITALLKRPSVRLSLPSAWIWLAATAVAIGGEIVIWNVQPAPGPLLAILPLFMLAGALPAGTILAYAAQRLDSPTTWRHMLVSLIYGAVVATLLASIVEGILFIALVVVLARFGVNVTFGENFLQNFDPSNPVQVLMFILVASVVAPVIEEGFKPLGTVFLLPRVRGPAEAFLLGLAAGEGFAVIETLTYFGLGQADWINVAIDRIGAGLLHGVGAGMGALGWYYLFRGEGVPLRWWRGFGALAYAVVQHGIFNASGLIGNLPPIGRWLSNPAPLVSLGTLPIERSFVVELVLYALVFSMLTYMTGRLRHAPQSPTTGSAPAATPAVHGPEQTPAMAMGGAR